MQNIAMQNLLTRRSIRNYKTNPVPADVLNRILEAGTYAPNGMGKQSAIILAITDKKVRDELSRINAEICGKPDSDPFYGAPVVLVVLADRAVASYVEDGALVMGNLLNAAHAEGLGSCWIHRARQEFETEYGKALLKQLGIEGDYVGIGHCILGYIAGDYPATHPRKDKFVYRV